MYGSPLRQHPQTDVSDKSHQTSLLTASSPCQPANCAPNATYSLCREQRVASPVPPLKDDAMPSATSHPHYPPHFLKGSIIQLADGTLKRVEELSTDDFMRSADISADLKIDCSTVISMAPIDERGTALLGFVVGQQQAQVTVESTWSTRSLCLGAVGHRTTR